MPEPGKPPAEEAPDEQLWQRWRQGERVDVADFPNRFVDLEATELVAVLLIDQRERWQVGERIPTESYLRRFPRLQANAEAVVELAYGEFLLREERGERPALAEYLWRFPEHEARLRQQVELHSALRGSSAAFETPSVASAAQTTRQHTQVARGDIPSLPGYEVQRELGRGGMGIVYLARQVHLNRTVALKMIRAGGLADAEERARFLAEAEAIAAVKHPGIVQVFDFGTHNDLPFFSLEFCAGGSLADRLVDHPLPPREAAQLVEQVARAVQAAHDKGIVHRDLKPANVLLGEDGQPRVVDFGLARRVESGPGMTATGSVVGTPSYMAPEQAQGRKDLGPAADVYSLGAILYDCLTGRPPFKAANVYDTLLQVVSEEPVPPRQLNPKVPIDLETICLKCLHKGPAARYPTAAELADDLGRWLAGKPIAARQAGRVERAVKWARRRPTAATLLGVSVLAALGLAVLSSVALWQWQTAVAALEREQQERTRRALAQVDALLSADPRAVPDILQNLPEQPEVLERLGQLWDGPDTRSNRPRRMRAGLALLPGEPLRVRDALVRWMLEVPDPAELLVVRNALLPHAEDLRAELWRQTWQTDQKPAARLRLLAVLAAFDPGGPGWKKVNEQALEPWLADNPLYLGTWAEALQPASKPLLGPLIGVFRGEVAERRAAAASILARYAQDEPRILVELIVQADDRQFVTLLPALRRQRKLVLPLLRREVAAQPGPKPSEAARAALARRQAGAGLALIRLGQAETVWPLLKHSPHPEARSRLTLRLGPVGVEARVLVERLQTAKEVSVRRALIQALGEFTAAQMPVELRQTLVPELLGWYRDDPDAGIHAAIDWLLRHGKEGPAPRALDWGQRKALDMIDRERKGTGLEGKRGWYVNAQGQTLAVVDAREPFLMSSPADEAGRRGYERRHWRQIGRRYALGTKPVTVAQFERFQKAHPQVKPIYAKQHSPEADCPIIGVTWYEAAQYCRWLSEQEGIAEDQMVYPSVAIIQKSKNGLTPLRLPANHLKRKGYRLPSEAEWEYACRAGARTSRYYGSSVDLLPRYAWHIGNAQDRTWPVGQKRPNDLGLFDMHGNVWVWCQENSRPFPAGTRKKPAHDQEDRGDVTSRTRTDNRILRGASFVSHPTDVRAAQRYHSPPVDHDFSVGFRVARTCD